MNQQTARLLKSPRRLLGAAICVMGAVLLVVAVWGWASSRNATQSNATTQPTPADEQQGDTADVSVTSQPLVEEQELAVSGTGTRADAATSTAPDLQAPAPVTQVQLQINGSTVGSVTIEPGQNHCDVLTTAQTSGIIHSLDMRWNEALKTYGVYGINGIGDPNTVNWVYEVNGKSPPMGCSLTKPAANDVINWKYLK